MRNKKYYREKINKKRLAYGNVGERRFHEFLKRICKEMNLNVVKHPYGVKRVDFIVSDPESGRDILIEVERRKTEKWVNKFPYNTVDFYERRVVRKNCLEVVLNDPCVRSLIYSHDVIENYRIETIYGPGEPYYSRKISTEHSKEFSLLKDVDKIKDIIYNAINGNLNNLNLNNKGKVNMSKSKEEISAAQWILMNKKSVAEHILYFVNLDKIKYIKRTRNKRESEKKDPEKSLSDDALIQSIRDKTFNLYLSIHGNNCKNKEGDSKFSLVKDYIYSDEGAGHISDGILREYDKVFFLNRQKYGIASKRMDNSDSSIKYIELQSPTVRDWVKKSMESEDVLNSMVAFIENEFNSNKKSTTKTPSDSRNDIQVSIAKNLSNEPKTSSHLSENVVFNLMEQLVALRKNNVEAFDKVIGLMKN
jgi:hypothetical protein